MRGRWAKSCIRALPGGESLARFPGMRRALLPFLAILLAACSVQAPAGRREARNPVPADSATAPLASLRTLDETSSASFRAEFYAAKDRTRFIVALSPT